MRRVLILIAILAFTGRASADDDIEFFEKKIRPLLVEQCYSCHSANAKKLKGGLKLDSREAMLKGGETGSAVVPGEPLKSHLIDAISYKNVDLLMPPKAKLPDAAIADLTKWIKDGAAWPSGAATKKEDKAYVFDLQKRKREHWAWQPINPGLPPAIKNAARAPSAIDRLLNLKLAEKGLIAAAKAEPRVILRRLSFDIVGVPPAIDMVREFEKSYAANPQLAIETAVDQLLASPQFGERWGRHWLDLMRYAESRGHEFDYNVPNAFQYRDYVIRALNADVPYDKFTQEHLAGDLLPSPRLHPKDGYNESILGTGFWFLGEQLHSPVDICQDRADRLDNQLDVMTKAFLGLTVACARCHDHKFDAISAKDYYALAGFLESSSYRLVPFETMEHNRKVMGELWKLREQHRAKTYSKADAARHEAQLANLEDYLEEALAILRKTPSAVPAATRAKLETDRIDRWVNHLRAAVKDRRDPFHHYACDALGMVTPARPVKGQTKTSVVIDYQNCPPESWMPDGFAFGPGPVQVGMNDGYGIATEASAEFDMIWSDLKASGSENEPGNVGRMMRAGKTIRTPKFDIENGLVHVRVRGAGMIYAAVEGYIMMAGPLHGNLVSTFKVGPDFRWHTIDLSVYKGRRVHLEFTPEGSDFALARAIQSVAPPVDDELDTPLEVNEWSGVKGPVTPKQHSARLRSHLAVAFAAVARGTPTRIDAHRVNWFRKHLDLFRTKQPIPLQELGISLDGGWTFARDADNRRMSKLLEPAGLPRLDSKLAPAILDGNAVNERVFIRGNYKTPGEAAPRRLLEALVGPGEIKSDHGSGRLELARQMTDPATNPFFTRVYVNRVWHHLFGRGIVGSVDNFGVLGEAPTHPELLDYLADQFARDGYSLKKMIRHMVLTDAYQRSSRPSDDAVKVDPANLYLQHARVRRLEGEAIRDALLSVSGRLDSRMYGPSVPVHLTDFQQGRGRPGSGPLDGAGRRSVYLSVRRNFLSPFLLAFDTPTPFSTVGRRTVSNVPAQALILLNDPFVHQQTDLWAKRILAEPGTTDERLARMYLASFGRIPTTVELAACREFVTSNDQAAWANLAHVLVNAKEFIFLE